MKLIPLDRINRALAADLPIPEKPPTDKRRCVLVVEDQRSTSAVLVHLLVRFGYWVESCVDVATALARLDYGGFDLLLTDVHLPDGDAWGLLSELATRGKRPERVISMSAMDPGEVRSQSMAFGCAGHLVSPCLADELAELLQ